MRSSYFGGATDSPLANLEKAYQSTATNETNIATSKIAADAAKMAAYFSMLGQKAHSDAVIKSQEAERAKYYFAENKKAELESAKLAQGAQQFAIEWGNKAKMADAAQAATSSENAANRAQGLTLADKELAGNLELAKVQSGRFSPQMQVEQMRQQGVDKETAQIAQNAAIQANQQLSNERNTLKAHAQQAWDGFRSGWYSDKQNGKLRRDAVDKANQVYKTRIASIHAGLQQAAGLVRYNPEADRFEPAVAPVATQGTVTQSEGTRFFSPVESGAEAPVIAAPPAPSFRPRFRVSNTGEYLPVQ